MGLRGIPFLLELIVPVSDLFFGTFGIRNRLVETALLIVGTLVAVQCIALITSGGEFLFQGFKTLQLFGQGGALSFDNRIQPLHLAVDVGNLFLDVRLFLDLGLPRLQSRREGCDQ